MPVSDELRNAGLKVTLPRRKILEVLDSSDKRHLSAEDVYRLLVQKGEDFGLATVYRVLTQFEGAGLVSRNNFEGGHAVFELSDNAHHDHIVCVDCGKVVEFVDPVIEQRQVQIATEHGFKIADHSMILQGICQDKSCPNRKNPGS
ncbi:MAG: ferric iron uptake transcriptional regulator [Gammaproteobacteria bacterium]|nr:ferric iron uptake transcriptional regulator [Gammaproteobacteria bacterium]